MSQLNELKTQHREVARLTFEGYKPTEIADRLEMPISTVYGIRHDPLFKQEVERLNDLADSEVVDVRRRLAGMTVKAVTRLDELLDSESEKIRLDVAKDVLDRSGYAAKQQLQHNHNHLHFNGEKIQELKERARQGGAVISDSEDQETSAEETVEAASELPLDEGLTSTSEQPIDIATSTNGSFEAPS